MMLKIFFITLFLLSVPVIASAQSALVPLFRLSNNNGNNLLTADPAERTSLIAQGWLDVGYVGYVYQGTGMPGTVPLYRLYNRATSGISSNDRLYTTDVSERDSYIAKGYILEGITAYVFKPNTLGFYKPLYRAYNTSTGQHLFTGGQIEYEGIGADWNAEGAIATILTSASAVSPILSATQVVQIASSFCVAINVPVTATGSAQFPVPREDDDDSPISHWQSRWQVTFGDQATLEVVDATRVVSLYRNHAYYLRPKPQQPAGQLISQLNAVQQATTAIQATMQTDALNTAQAQLVQNNSNQPNVSDSYWQITWDRLFQGIPYHNDSASAVVDAETGEIESLSLTYFTQPPVNTSVSVTSSQAQTIAQTQLINSGIQSASCSSVQLQIAQTNSFWQNGSETPTLGPGRIAWIYAFSEANARIGEVWVDAQTGSIIGGLEYGIRGNESLVHKSKPLKENSQLKKKSHNKSHPPQLREKIKYKRKPAK